MRIGKGEVKDRPPIEKKVLSRPYGRKSEEKGILYRPKKRRGISVLLGRKGSSINL